MEELKKILYVEDLIMSVNIVKKMCGNMYLVDYALNIEDALSKIKERKYDLILLDINLQQPMDGITFAKILKEEQLFVNKPIILVTAYQFDYETEDLRNLGLTDYLQKPFTKLDLLNKIDENI